MVMQVEHSSGGFGVLSFPDLEPPAPEFAPPAAPPPTPPTPAPSNWVEQLPPAVFGPPAPHPSQTPVPTVLAELAPAPAVAVIEAAPVVWVATPVATLAVPSTPTAPAMEIATLELTLADPLNQELIHHHGGALPVLDLTNLNPVLQEQVDRYGASLTARLMQLAQANAAVRDLYLAAMDQAAQTLGPETMGAVFEPGVRGNRGESVPDSWRFDPVAFTQAYAQAGQLDGAPLAQRAFAATFGSNPLQAWEQVHGGDAEFTQRGHTLAGSFELSAPTLTDLDGHPSRERMGWTGASLNADQHGLHLLSLTAPSELHNPQAVWFDAGLGWVTPSENIVVKQDFLDKAIPVVFIGVMTWATAGAFGVAGGAGVTAGTGIGAGAGVVGAMTAGAAFGAIGGFYGGLIGEGKIDLGGMFRGALTGAVTAGVVRATGLDSMGITTGTNGQGQQVVTGIEVAQRALAVTGQATLQGALQQISGGDFVDGFTAGLANGLGVEIARGLQLQIDTLSNTGSIDATQAGALRQFARAAQSAVSLLGNPEDPGHAFAMTFVNGLVGDVQQGLDARSVGDTVSAAWASAPDETAAETARLARQNDAPQNLSLSVSPGHLAHDQALAQVNARWGVGGDGRDEGPPFEAGPEGTEPGLADYRIEIVGRRIPYVEQVAEAVGGDLHALFVRGVQAASGALDALEIAPLANVKAEIQTYLDARAEQGLSEAEIVVFGALYAASEALFPTNPLDFAGGIGKGIAAVGAVVKLERGVDEIAGVAAEAAASVSRGHPGGAAVWAAMGATRIAQRVAELAQEGHGLARHGGAVTDEQLAMRAATGVAPDGSSVVRNGQIQIPQASTAFNSDLLLAQSDLFVRERYLEQAIALERPGATRVSIEGVELGLALGRGYGRVDAVPGGVGPMQFFGELSRVTAHYVYDSQSRTWRTVSIYPVGD